MYRTKSCQPCYKVSNDFSISNVDVDLICCSYLSEVYHSWHKCPNQQFFSLYIMKVEQCHCLIKPKIRICHIILIWLHDIHVSINESPNQIEKIINIFRTLGITIISDITIVLENRTESLEIWLLNKRLMNHNAHLSKYGPSCS